VSGKDHQADILVCELNLAAGSAVYARSEKSGSIGSQPM
jgi:hypothetical protein